METVSRALKLLKVIATRPMRVQEVAVILNVHKSSASRLLSVLQENNFVRLNREKKYELGYAVFELAYILKENLDLRVVARPYLEAINATTNETVHLAILDGAEVVYIDKIDSNRLIRMYSRTGRRASSHCTGVGKAILAFLPPKQLNKLLDKMELKKYTSNTIITKEALQTELKEIRKNSLAWDREEHEEDIYCIAAPIFDFNKRVIGSISISITIKYTSVEKLVSYEAELKKSAENISREMGYV